jgi:signal transduction histidine kinase
MTLPKDSHVRQPDTISREMEMRLEDDKTNVHGMDSFVEKWRKPRGYKAAVAICAIASGIACIGLLVYETGGTAFAWLNLMYLPIVLSAALFRVPGGIAAALLSGLVIGPFMPLYVPGDILQPTANWLARTGFFLLIGAFTGLLFTWLNAQYDRLIKAHDELARSHRELRDAQMELIQAAKLESIGRLAAGVAHEVKNPLAIIQLGVNFLDTTASGNPEVKEVLDEIDAAVKRADSVIKGLVDFSRSEELELKPHDLNVIIEKALSLVRHELTKEHVALETRLDGSISPVALDRNKIQQVFINLFMNAVQAMEGGGSLTVTTTEKNLSRDDCGRFLPGKLRFSAGDRVVMVEIADTGPGIPENKLDKLFDPFFTTKPIGKGTGLGLSISRKIIELHDAMIDIRNREEGGVVVKLLFKPNQGSASS